MKTFQYFQPEYVSKFKCDGSKCNARCCKGWTITIDDATYKKYSRIKPKTKAKEILSHIKFDDNQKQYVVSLQKSFSPQINFDEESNRYIVNLGKEFISHVDFGDEKNPVVHFNTNFPCPFLTEDKLCRIQLEYGEDYLSKTCSSYPRHTYAIGEFFERSMTLTCPVAAEMILFNPKPMRFEFIEVPDKVHSKHGRIVITKQPVFFDNAEIVREIQITMISILQQQQFSIDERLILLGIFLDKLHEYKTENQDLDILFDLIVGYRSKKFLVQEMSPLLQSFTFDANKFMAFMINFINYAINCLLTKEGQRFFNAFDKTLNIKHNKNNQVKISEIIANYESLADARKEFLDKYSTFLENYLINELFYSYYPWRFVEESITKNFAVFLISYKIFELMTFSTVHSGLDSKEDLLSMVNWFMARTDHNPNLYKRFLELLKDRDDTYLLMATLL